MSWHRLLPTLVVGWLVWIGSGQSVSAQTSSFGIGLPQTPAVLVRTLLTAVSWRRRAEAAMQLGQTGDPRVLEALATAAANDNIPQVRQAATEAIRLIRGNQPRPPVWPGPFPPQPPQDPNAAIVDSWYQRYLGRSVDPGGLNNFTGMLRRGVSPEETQSIILGSDEFFNNSGGTPASFISGLYRVLLGRNPTQQEVLGWLRRYNAVQANRSRVAIEVLDLAQREQLGRQPNNPVFPW